ncbi:MAG: O-linked N-acetylglucosamine transferase, SPINDLY family protein [Spirulinaceae cyanobacterium]
MSLSLLESAQHLQSQGQYSEATQVYVQLLEQNPEQLNLYWLLGLNLLLQEQVEEAQATWLTGMFADGELSLEERNTKLIKVLAAEAQTQYDNQALVKSWLIREQIREVAPRDLDNLLWLLKLAHELDSYESEWIGEWQLVAALNENESRIDPSLLLKVVQTLLEPNKINEEAIQFIKLVIQNQLSQAQQQPLASIIHQLAKDLDHLRQRPDLSAQLCEIALIIEPENFEHIRYLTTFYQRSDQYQKGIEAAYRYHAVVQSLPDQVDAVAQILKALAITGGRWQAVKQCFAELEFLLGKLIEQELANASLWQISYLINSYFFAPYHQDNPQRNRKIQNGLAQLCQKHFRRQILKELRRYPQQHSIRFSKRDPQQQLRIGYLSSTLRRHSVGWLVRSLMQHHNTDKFAIHLYLMADPNHSEPLQDWYISKATKAFKSNSLQELAEAIFADEIDVLIELDSITMDTTCTTAMLKPAPVQATWLGWDASGIPAIDYFIADNYVLPDYAQDYYQERIYRLPQTYIAVDGFEVSLPTLRREELDIPANAVVYYSVQQGNKRHPATIRWQLQILKQVTGSYFCIKGSSDNADVQKAFLELADEMGVKCDRLKFLDVDILESTHRANMEVLADIVLDTYPYNGATTTMETLWLGIPLVTRVGEQFSARNSYTMLKNVGVEAGIAYNAEEYVDWGVRLGTDHDLRRQVATELRQARRHAPLWNGRQFARDMEAAYEQMWANYVAQMTAESIVE